MLVRLVEEHRRGTATLFAGTLLDLPVDEAMVLMQDGVALSASRDELSKETR